MTDKGINHLPPTFPYIVSILLPVFNERSAIIANISEMSATIEQVIGSDRYEILLLNNGSTDGTEALGPFLREHAPRVNLHNIAEKGRGVALNEGYRKAKGEIIGILSIDRAWDESFLGDGIRLLREGADVVFGQKSHALSVVDRPLKRSIASHLIRWVVSVLFLIRPQDTQCVKVFRRSRVPFLLDLREYNYFAECEFFLRARKADLSIASVCVKVTDRRRNSKVRLASFWEFLREAWDFRLATWNFLDLLPRPLRMARNGKDRFSTR